MPYKLELQKVQFHKVQLMVEKKEKYLKKKLSKKLFLQLEIS